MFAVIHVTDLHFGKATVETFADPRVLVKGIAETVAPIRDRADDVLLVVSGDLVYEGQEEAYDLARRFIENLRDELKVTPRNIIICPGNHDIVTKREDSFAPIDELTWTVTNSSDHVFGKHSSLRLELPLVDILVLNSAFTRDHHFGQVDIDCIPSAKPSDKPRMAVVHHNPIGIHPKDSSAIRNAYPLLLRLCDEGTTMLLHGHQHFHQAIKVGRNGMLILGGGSLNFKNNAGVSNQFNVAEFEGKSVVRSSRYVWNADTAAGGKLGIWTKTGIRTC